MPGTDPQHTADPPETAWRTLAPLIDLVTPLAVRAAATLRIADHMGFVVTPVAELARRSGTDADALERLLRHLAHHGLFLEPSQAAFALNDTAALLRSDHPSGMRTSLDLDGFGGQMDLAFTGLVHTVRTGEPAWETVFGAPFWQYLADNPAMSASFDATMSAGSEYVADDALAYDWSTARHVVDVGGGDGALLADVLAAHPSLDATIVELPRALARARARFVEKGLDARVTLVGQSFFDPLPTGGDLYVLNSILHDWPDDDARTILRRCAEACGPTGRVLVIEDGTSHGDEHAEMDLRMLVLCGGRERTLEDFAALTAAAGLSIAAVRTTPLGQVGIECVRDDA